MLHAGGSIPLQRAPFWGKFSLWRIVVAEKWDEQVYRMGETITHEKAYAAPHRGSTTQQLQGRDYDRDRPWGCLEPLLHTQRRWRSSGPGPVSYQSLGSP